MLPGTLQVKLILAAAVGIGLLSLGGWFTYRWLEASMVRMQNQLDTANNALKGVNAQLGTFKGALDEANRIAKQQQKFTKDLRDNNAAFSAALRAMATAEPSLATPVPLSARQLRRARAGCPTDVSVPCTDGGIGADAVPADARRNDGGPASRSAGIAERP